MSRRFRWILLAVAIVANAALLSTPAEAFNPIGYCSTCSGGEGHYTCCVYTGVCEESPEWTCCDEPADCGMN